MNKRCLAFVILFFSLAGNAQSRQPQWLPWQEEPSLSRYRQIVPAKYLTYYTAPEALEALLAGAPHEKEVSPVKSPHVIALPDPTGRLQHFRIVECALLQPPLDKSFPGIRSYNIKGIDDPYAWGKLDWNDFGLHVMVTTPEGDFFIDPYSTQNRNAYIVYYRSDFEQDPGEVFSEPGTGTVAQPAHQLSKRTVAAGAIPCTGDTLYNYRLAIACTHQYAIAATGQPSPTLGQALSKIAVTINRVNGIYEREAAIRFLLVPTTTAVIFTSATADPFTANSNLLNLIAESQAVIDNSVGNSAYDIGHTFSTSGGGLASTGCICSPAEKAQGATGSSKPYGDPYDIDYVAHEIGHQMGAGHTFNAVTGNCNGNRSDKTAYEPGSGITIMGYAGICGFNNIAKGSIPYFHTVSFDEIVKCSRLHQGSKCATKEATGNKRPYVSFMPGKQIIPRGTPFFLQGMAIDPDYDPLTYSWEEISKGSGPSNWNADEKPYFKSYPPQVSALRYFPSIHVVRSGNFTEVPGEYLSPTPQRLAFRLTVRDNRLGGGGLCSDSTIVEMATSGPFSVTVPNAEGIVWKHGTQQYISWEVNGTDDAPVSCKQVNILCSLDDGYTYHILAANTPNDGYEMVTLPEVQSSSAYCRIKIESVANIFYDISNKPFTITPDETVGLTGSGQGEPAWLDLWPNPAGDRVSYGISDRWINTACSIAVFDITGRKLLEETVQHTENRTGTLSINTLSRGVYFVRLTSGSGYFSGRIIKE